jgi:ubiquinol oxidase
MSEIDQPLGAEHLSMPPRLSVPQLREEQERTLATPRRHPGPAAKALFVLMDVVYGTPRTLSKFRVLEIIARVPYQAWENVAYVAVTHRSSKTGFARRIFDRVQESRAQQDNEQWHLLILEELVDAGDKREGFVKFRILPQVIAFTYYQISWLLYALKPKWSYGLNADFEDHAEHEYALFVQENPWLDEQGYDGQFKAEYGHYDTLSDLFRQIGHDERIHKQESIRRMAEPRFD